MTTDITKRVARGVKWLDRHAPGWEKRVNLLQFKLRSDCRCVLGQVFAETHGSYPGVLKGPWNPKGVISHRDALACGFDVSTSIEAAEARDTFAQLQREWKRVIRERKGGKK